MGISSLILNKERDGQHWNHKMKRETTHPIFKQQPHSAEAKAAS